MFSPQKFVSHISCTFQHIEGEVRLEVPDPETDRDETELTKNKDLIHSIEEECLQWTKQIASTLEQQLKKTPEGNGPLAEIELWRERNSALSALSEQLKHSPVKRMLSILSCTDASRENAILQNFELQCSELTKYHVEAKNTVYFLSRLEKHFNNITYGAGFQIVLDTIPSMMNALRMVWAMSRHYNSDDRMVPLMERIAWQLAETVAKVIDIRTIFRNTHSEIKARTQKAKKTLEFWKECYFETRAKIEASGRDARWEFDCKRLFERTDYMATICQDIFNICQVLEEFYGIFGPQLESVTGNPQRTGELLKRVDGLVDSIEKVDFEPFILKHHCQWKKHMEWFNQEVSAVEDEAKCFINESFKTLLYAEGAFDPLLKFKYIGSREAVSTQRMKKFSDILLQCDKEVDTTHALMFKQYKHIPPVSKNHPPVVHAIAWERSMFTIIPFQAVEDRVTSHYGNVVMIKNLTRFNQNVASSKPLFQVEAILSASEILLVPAANDVYSLSLNHIQWFAMGIVYRWTENFVCWMLSTCNETPPHNVEGEDEPIIFSFFPDIAEFVIVEFVTTTSNYMQKTLANLTKYLSRWKRSCPLWKLDNTIVLEKFAAKNPTFIAFDVILQFYFNLANEVASQPKIQDEDNIQLHMTMLADTVRDHAKNRVSSLRTLLQEAAKTDLFGLKMELEITQTQIGDSSMELDKFHSRFKEGRPEAVGNDFDKVKSNQQAVFKGVSIGASVTTTIVFLAQIAVSFFMQQGREYSLVKLLPWCMVILPYYMPVCQGMAIQKGNPATFSCTVANLETSLWRVRRPDGTFQAFAQGGKLYSQYRDKFKLEIRSESSGSNTTYIQTLTLKKATVDDDGQYRCEEEGWIRSSTSLTVESTPILHLKINNTVITTNINVVLNREVAVVCIAEGGKPQVTLSWRVNGEEVNGHVIKNPRPSPEGVNSTIQYSPAAGDEILTCVASGQKVTPQTNVSVGLVVQYSPHCVILVTNGTNAYVVTCSCNANPEVKKNGIYVNGSLFSNESKTTLPSDKPAVVFCKGTNDVGSFATKPQNLYPLPGNVSTQGSGSWWIFLVVVLILVAAVAFVCYEWKKKNEALKEANDRANTSQQAGIDAAQRLQDATRPQVSEQVPMVTFDADQGDITMVTDNEGEGKVENGTTKQGVTEQTEVTIHSFHMNENAPTVEFLHS